MSDSGEYIEVAHGGAGAEHGDWQDNGTVAFCVKALSDCWFCWSVVHYDQSLGHRLDVTLPPEPPRPPEVQAVTV